MTLTSALSKTFSAVRLFITLSFFFLRFYAPLIITLKLRRRRVKRVALRELEETGLTKREAESLAEIVVPEIPSLWEVMRGASEKEDRG